MARRTKVIVRSLICLLLMAIAPASAAGSAQAAPYCGIWWGSLSKGAGAWGSPGPGLKDVRAGQHPCFDRLVFDLSGTTATAYNVRYVNELPDGLAPGRTVPLRGGAKLAITIKATTTATGRIQPFLHRERRHELVRVDGYRTLRQVAWASVDEDYFEPTQSHYSWHTFGVGVRARLPFRVFTLPGGPAGGNRVVIDVAHRW